MVLMGGLKRRGGRGMDRTQVRNRAQVRIRRRRRGAHRRRRVRRYSLPDPRSAALGRLFARGNRGGTQCGDAPACPAATLGRLDASYSRNCLLPEGYHGRANLRGANRPSRLVRQPPKLCSRPLPGTRK
eukprot:scaffold9115_cov115-Isochrysis_galbana.AAC.4